MSNEQVVNETPSQETPKQETPARKRKPRAPKAPKVRKPRVALGPIVLCAKVDGSYTALSVQPPAVIAHDAVQVARWAAQQTALQTDCPTIRMVREYNVTLKIATVVRSSASLVIDTKEVEQA